MSTGEKIKSVETGEAREAETGEAETKPANPEGVHGAVACGPLRNQAVGKQAGKRVLCLWFPNWAIQRRVVSEPGLRHQRMVLFRRDSRRGQIVLAASPLALRGGVGVGMSISEAKSLLCRSGDFHVFEHEPDFDLTAMEALVDSLEGFSPVVGMESIEGQEARQGRRPDSIFLDITGVAHLFGDESQLARQVVVHCDRLGYLPRVAVADTVGGAWALARFFAGPYFAQHQQPVVLPSANEEVFRGLPVEALRLPGVTVETLSRLGIGTIGQVQRLPRSELAMRFGDAIHRRLDQLTGKIEEPVIARRKPAEWVAEQLLEHATNHRETIGIIIARLVSRLCEQMRFRQQGALEWGVRLVCQSGPAIEFCVKLFQPTATTDHVMPLVEMQLEQMLSPHTRKFRKKQRANHRRPLPASALPSFQENSASLKKGSVNSKSNSARLKTDSAERKSDSGSGETESEFHRYTTMQVTEVVVSVNSSVLLAQQQRQLFDESPRLDSQSLAQLINRLASRLGDQNVVYPSLQSGAQPEYSYRLKPLVGASRRRRHKRTLSPAGSHVLARPFRLFRPPIRLRSLGVATHEGEADCENAVAPPALFFLDSESVGEGSPGNPNGAGSNGADPGGGEQRVRLSRRFASPAARQVVASCGPERIETGWWRGVTVCRDYWRVETEAGQQYWVYRDLRNGEWFLHGEF